MRVRAGCELVPVGTDPIAPRAGDLLFCHRLGFMSAMIRFGEWVRFRGGDNWSHVACFRDEEVLVEALTRGVRKTDMQAYRFTECVHVRTRLSKVDAMKAAHFLDACVGNRYGFLTDLSIALRFLTPGRGLTFGARGTKMCSGMAAEMLCRGWYLFEYEPESLSPAELAIDLHVPASLKSARETAPVELRGV